MKKHPKSIFKIRQGRKLDEVTDYAELSYEDYINSNAPNRIGLLYIHGFSSTAHSMRYLAEQTQDAVYMTSVPLLTGHGTSPEDMKNSTRDDWYASVEKAYINMQSKCDHVMVIGQSMGGLLATLLASRHLEIDHLILVAPAFYPSRLLNLSPFLTPTLSLLGVHYLYGIGGNIKSKSAYEITYDKIPVKSHLELHRLCQEALSTLPKLKTPTSIVASTHDRVISARGIRRAFAQMNKENKNLYWVENSNHVISLDNDKDKIVEIIQNVLKKIED